MATMHVAQMGRLGLEWRFQSRSRDASRDYAPQTRSACKGPEMHEMHRVGRACGCIEARVIVVAVDMRVCHKPLFRTVSR